METPYYNATIWEAGRATSAAPIFFKGIDIGDPHLKESFVDGGVGCNNPSEYVIKEAIREFGRESTRQVACIVSIGTGKRKVIGFDAPTGYQKLVPKDILKALAGIATETEKTASGLQERFFNYPGLYCRLNVDCGLETVELAAWEELGGVQTHTTSYLEKHEVDKTINLIVDGLLGKAAILCPLAQLGAYFHSNITLFSFHTKLVSRCNSSAPVATYSWAQVPVIDPKFPSKPFC